jgi:hypothetical protein
MCYPISDRGYRSAVADVEQQFAVDLDRRVIWTGAS